MPARAVIRKVLALCGIPPKKLGSSPMTQNLLVQSVAIMGMLTALGAAIDAFLLNPRRAFIYHKMEDWWIFLTDAHVPDIHKRVAAYTLNLLKLVAGKRPTLLRALFVLIPFSYAWTMCWSLYGFVSGEQATLDRMHINGSFSIYQSVYAWIFGMTYDVNVGIYWLLFLPLNSALFDSATVFCTILITKLVQRQAPIPALGSFAANIVIALTIAALGFSSSVVGARLLRVSLYSETVPLNLFELPSFWKESLSFAQNASVALSAITSLIPVLLYVALLMALVFYKLAGETLRRATSKFLEAAVDKPVDKFAPFTLFGTVTGLLASILRVFIELLKS